MTPLAVEWGCDRPNPFAVWEYREDRLSFEFWFMKRWGGPYGYRAFRRMGMHDAHSTHWVLKYSSRILKENRRGEPRELWLNVRYDAIQPWGKHWRSRMAQHIRQLRRDMRRLEREATR